MSERISVVVTSIAAPNEILRNLARGCSEHNYDFIVIGDQASPTEFHIDRCDFYDLERQLKTNLKSAQKCPTRHYSRKNIGYLLAMQKGASVILETDDDNIPYEGFWQKPRRILDAAVLEHAGWVNVYRYFSDQTIWPRGFPLEQARDKVPAYESLEQRQLDCPVRQGLVDENPDVDAVYRLILPLPQTFNAGRKVALAEGCWCPFNSQNTMWWSDAFELLYLPSHCSFRMTDIWRSFVAQKIAHVNGWALLFDEPTMKQQRNVHNLMRDFEQELPGYLHNVEICEALDSLTLEPGADTIADNLTVCYEKLAGMSVVGADELQLLKAWLEDVKSLRR